MNGTTPPEDTASERLGRLRNWSSHAGRHYEWRKSEDPWLVFVSEMLLRRTRADQVSSVLPAALRAFPDPTALANAPIARLYEVFRSAGLNGRIEQLHDAARMVRDSFGGKMPVDEKDLRSLPGVGPYVAAIVSARLTGVKVVLVDTNSVRVAIRTFGLMPGTKDPRRERAVMEAVGDLLGGPATAKDWFAVIDLAHSVCRPTNPACQECPVEHGCAYAAMARI